MLSRAHALAARRRLALDEATDVRADAGCVEDALGRRVGEALIPTAGGGATRASTLDTSFVKSCAVLAASLGSSRW